jgi:predicted MFS family arabinose efflux permease
VRVLKRIVRLIWGDDVEPEIRPLLYVGLAGSLGASSMWTFMGIWAIDKLGASSSSLAVALLVGACLAATTGYVAGHLSDRIGRRPLILAGWAILSVYELLFVAVGERTTLGLVVLAGAGMAGSIGWAATQAFVADLVARERHESAFASLRVANNLGVVGGPVLGGLLLLVSWTALFLGVSVLTAAVFGLAWRLLPRRGAYAPEEKPERGSFAVIRRDHVFALFLLSTALAYIVYVAYETVLPISLVDTHGLAPSTWGFLVILNPLMVTLFQLRLTRWTSSVSPLLKLATAIMLMGLPFLVLSVSAAVPVVLAVIFVFVIGEMLWVPTSQAVAAGLAPVDLRGAYLGAFSSMGAVGFALAPFTGLLVRDAAGDTAMWGFFAVMSIVGGAVGAFAVHLAYSRLRERREEEESPAPVGAPPGLPVEPALVADPAAAAAATAGVHGDDHHDGHHQQDRSYPQRSS